MGEGGGGAAVTETSDVPTWKDYAQAFSDVVEALERVDQFMREQHFTTLDLFRVCDVNDSGSLSKDELVENFLRIGLPITYGQSRHLVDFLDGNNTNEIEYLELDDALRHHSHGQKYWVRRYLQSNHAEVRDKCFPNHWLDREDFRLAFPRFEPKPKEAEAEVLAVEEVLQKPKEAREHYDLHILLAFLETVPVLRELGTRRLWDLGKRLTMMCARPDDLIIKQGTKGRLLFIIFQGSVGLQYNRLQMTVLGRREVFGDKALREAPNETPTFVALEFTKLACVNSEDYFQYIHEHMQNQLRDVSRWMHDKVPVLVGLKKVVVDDVVPYLVPMKMPKGTEVFVQGSPSVSLFFIKKGTVEIRSTYMVPHVNRLPMSQDRSGYTELRKRRRFEKTYGTLGPGQCFGEDCVMGHHDRQYTAVVVSEGGAELYQLRRHQAARSFMRHKDKFIEQISAVYPFFTTPPAERYQQVLAVVEETRIKESLRKEAMGPHYLKRLSSGIPTKLRTLRESSSHHNNNHHSVLKADCQPCGGGGGGHRQHHAKRGIKGRKMAGAGMGGTEVLSATFMATGQIGGGGGSNNGGGEGKNAVGGAGVAATWGGTTRLPSILMLNTLRSTLPGEVTKKREQR